MNTANTQHVVDNFEIIKDFLNFKQATDVVYRVMIISRRKDNNELSKTQKLKDSFYIYECADLDRLRDKIIAKCHEHNARAYINLRARSLKDVAKKAMCILSNYIYTEEYKAVRNVYDTAFGNSKTLDKLFLIDYDHNPDFSVQDILDYLEVYEHPVTKQKIHIKLVSPTRNGTHIVTSPFDKSYLTSKYPIDVFSEGQLLLYFGCG